MESAAASETVETGGEVFSLDWEDGGETEAGISPHANVTFQKVEFKRTAVGQFEGLTDEEILDVVYDRLVIRREFID